MTTSLPARLALPPGLNVGEAFARILLHQREVMLHHAARIPPVADDPEPVHQTRVALRRMRSALSVFRAATGAPAISELAQDLRAFGHLLGPARAWDVFLADTGRRLLHALPDDKALRVLIRAATRRRDAAYTALAQDRDGPHFSTLTEHLNAIVDGHLWRDGLQQEQRALLAMPLDRFGVDILARLHRRVRRAGRHIARLDAPALHALRLRGKRLRYAAEFFSTQFDAKSARRYIGRLAALQEQLGWLNDAATTATLMAGLRARGHAGGIVLGYTAAEAEFALRDLPATWKRFRAAEPFWVSEAVMEKIQPP